MDNKERKNNRGRASLSGGMLILGDIPNITAAHKQKMSRRAWAFADIPFGLLLMAVYFLILYY